MTSRIDEIQDVNVRAILPLISPRLVKEAEPTTPQAAETVFRGRDALRKALEGKDPRLIAVVGPCSIHDEAAACEYADRLARLAREVEDRLLVVMRVYFEKPRTTVGWKGLINDPYLDDSFDIEAGLKKARKILLHVAHLGLPAGTEVLDPITPQYLADLIAWSAIGARTTESQTHRQMASGLSMPVGFKNGTDGALQTAIDALKASRHPHSFLGIDNEGRTCVVHTKGNPWGHLILRGGRSGHNYDAGSLMAATAELERANLPQNLIVDCSHANSGKNHQKQAIAWKDVVEQRVAGNRRIAGLMLESNLHDGNQALTRDLSKLRYGVSITDACIGWDETVELVRYAHQRMESAIPCPAASATTG